MVHEILTTQRLAVLATAGKAGPHSSLVAFAVTGDGKGLLFSTPRRTRKYINLSAEPRVSFLMDNRRNKPSDIERAAAVTVTGRARELQGAARRQAAGILLARHPALKGFLADPGSAIFHVRILRCSVAGGFAS